MSSETAARKKRHTSDSSTPAPDGDHRKKRRNRTTQSCLNCHTSKRMCDRKRPACARCTQLGLTGLCVYEVDDPSQRIEAQDESSRLLKRVAELEGVIRELKNKPHPRWIQSANSGEEFEKWHSRPPGGSDESCPSNAPSPPNSSSSSEREDSVPGGTRLSQLSKPGTGTSTSPIYLQTNIEGRRKSPYSPHSPSNTPSPTLLTPTDEYPLSHIDIANQSPIALSSDYDLASMFLSYPGLMGCGDGSFPSVTNVGFNKQSVTHCGCLQEITSHNAMLELSLRLRKTSDILTRSPSHRVGGPCYLHQRISELDSFTTNVLSDMSTSPGDLSESLMWTDHGAGQQLTMQENFHHHSQMYLSRPSSMSRGSMQNVRSWDIIPSGSNPPTPFDDSFMTWEPPRRP